MQNAKESLLSAEVRKAYYIVRSAYFTSKFVVHLQLPLEGWLVYNNILRIDGIMSIKPSFYYGFCLSRFPSCCS